MTRPPLPTGLLPTPTTTGPDRILVVDDEPSVRESIVEYLLDEGFAVEAARDGIEALDIITRREFDLVITDLSMPHLDGYQLIREVERLERRPPFVVLTGAGTVDNAIQAVKMGAYDFVAKPIINLETFRLCVDRALEKSHYAASESRYRASLEGVVADQIQELLGKNQLLQEYARELEAVSVSVIASLSMALEEKDPYTAGHSRRVTTLALGMANHLGLDRETKAILETAAQLHDVGKLMVDVSFINKPGPLSPEEWAMMRRHPGAADRFLSPFHFLDRVRPLIRHHHEKLDGTGYPDGLKGDEIDLATRILSAADCYDAMTSRRAYREPMTPEEALAGMELRADRHLGRDVLKALRAVQEKI